VATGLGVLFPRQPRHGYGPYPPSQLGTVPPPEQLLLGSYICTLLYWIFSFAKKEAERREFTPQMQNLLLAVAGVARAERTALTAASRPGNLPRNER